GAAAARRQARRGAPRLGRRGDLARRGRGHRHRDPPAALDGPDRPDEDASAPARGVLPGRGGWAALARGGRGRGARARGPRRRRRVRDPGVGRADREDVGGDRCGVRPPARHDARGRGRRLRLGPRRLRRPAADAERRLRHVGRVLRRPPGAPLPQAGPRPRRHRGDRRHRRRGGHREADRPPPRGAAGQAPRRPLERQLPVGARRPRPRHRPRVVRRPPRGRPRDAAPLRPHPPAPRRRRLPGRRPARRRLGGPARAAPALPAARARVHVRRGVRRTRRVGGREVRL
ncbi:MAG: Ribulosamine/erythrulosamine 3-kinase potentially involved in protein deglycation, partial [uncultured Nocardioides sp.]